MTTSNAIRSLAAVLAKAVDNTEDLYDDECSEDYRNEWEDGARAALAWMDGMSA